VRTIACFFIAAFSVVVPAVAVAQTAPGPFAPLQSRLAPGERIAIWDGKAEIRGRLSSVSPAEIVVTIDGVPRHFTPAEVRRLGVVRSCVSRTGLLKVGIGAGIGLAAGSFWVENGRHCGTCAANGAGAFRVMTTALGAGIAAGIVAGTDWIYKASNGTVAIAPMVGPARRGALIMVTF
jgi:hypothetical protein